MAWQKKKLGDVCDIIGGGTPSKSNEEFYKGDIPWATVRDMRSENLAETEFKITEKAVLSSSTNVISKDNVIIATRVGLGKVCLLSQDTAINQDLRAVIPKSLIRLDRNFLFLWFKSVSLDIQNEGTGATVQGVKLPFIKSLLIPIPSLLEQKQIVTILDEAFANIDHARQLAERNLKNARELFDNTLTQIFCQSDDGWITKTLSSVCVIKPPKNEARKQLDENSQVSFVPMGCLGIGSKNLQLRQERKLSEVVGSYTYFAENDVLLAKITPCFENGKLGIARSLSNKVGFGSSEFIVFRCNDELLPDFLYYFLDRQSFRDQGKALMTGAVGHKRVAKDFIENYQISFPDIEQQRNIVAMLDDLRNSVRELEKIYQQKITALDELKQSLLQKAFRGELTQDQAAA